MCGGLRIVKYLPRLATGLASDVEKEDVNVVPDTSDGVASGVGKAVRIYCGGEEGIMGTEEGGSMEEGAKEEGMLESSPSVSLLEETGGIANQSDLIVF